MAGRTPLDRLIARYDFANFNRAAAVASDRDLINGKERRCGLTSRGPGLIPAHNGQRYALTRGGLRWLNHSLTPATTATNKREIDPRLKTGYLGVPKIRALFEATYLAGLHKAGIPEE